MKLTSDTGPSANGVTEGSVPRSKARWLAAIGVALYTGPIWGLVGTLIGMIRAFDTLGKNSDATPEVLAQDIRIAMMASMIGLGVGLIGAIVILVTFLGTRYRESWFFWWSVSLSAFWCVLGFPIGLVAGLPLLILFLTKRVEFRRRDCAAGMDL
jgi:hypothetical protein